ncbi:hypothetical protein H0H92_006372 [Tricholoma furcatifolium]|nr:hypothetical protein H0H92_006372 [Tricholoma furcatifolium]
MARGSMAHGVGLERRDRNAGPFYQTLVSSILLRPHATEVAPVPLNGVPCKQDNPLITALPPLPPPHKSFSPPVPIPSPALASLPPKPACPTPPPVFNEPHLPLQPLTLQAKTEILDYAVPPVKPSQSRKSKKVKKLVFDGVPSSVQYLVWSMLTDGKARYVTGLTLVAGNLLLLALEEHMF